MEMAIAQQSVDPLDSVLGLRLGVQGASQGGEGQRAVVQQGSDGGHEGIEATAMNGGQCIGERLV